MPGGPEAHLLFIGDIVGEAGLALLEAELPSLQRRLRADFVVANGENASLTGESPVEGIGMTVRDVGRLRTLGVDAITGGNHSWDGDEAIAALAEPEVLRPLNLAGERPGRGALVVERRGVRLGVVNLASATVLPRGTAYISDVGMTGPGGGIQGYAPQPFVDAMRGGTRVRGSAGFAEGEAELGAVLIRVEDGRAIEIERVTLPS